MKITELDKLQEGDAFVYQGVFAVITYKRPKDPKLALGVETEDKSIHLAFRQGEHIVALTGRLDAKGTRWEKRASGEVEVLTALDLVDYQPLPAGHQVTITTVNQTGGTNIGIQNNG